MLLVYQKEVAMNAFVMKDIQVSMIRSMLQVSLRLKEERKSKNALVECTELINECENGSHQCHQNAFCFDTKDSYGCICEDGFDGDGFNCSVLCFEGTKPSKETCVDIDECAMNSTVCETSNTICKNSFGSYSCVCLDGLVCDDEDGPQMTTKASTSSSTTGSPTSISTTG